MKKDPNNAYGSKAAREKALRDVSGDILKRDQKSLDRSSDYIPTYTREGKYNEIRAGQAPSKTEAMEFLDAHRRRTKDGDSYLLPREMKELGEKGESEAKALRKPVKKAKGGSVSKRADGIATKGKTKGRFV
jgi:hypothetical protein